MKQSIGTPVINIPEGWALVPKEPTPDMLRAAAYHDFHSPTDPTWREIYIQMIEARPKVPVSP